MRSTNTYMHIHQNFIQVTEASFHDPDLEAMRLPFPGLHTCRNAMRQIFPWLNVICDLLMLTATSISTK